MKIQAEVSLYVVLADGRRVSVSHTVNRTAGDNPAYAAGEALHALTEAQTAALRGFAAQIRPDGTLPEPEADPEPPQTMSTVRRDLVLSKLDEAGVPLDAPADTARSSMLDIGYDTIATDAELESFQEMRRQIRASQSDCSGSLQVDSLVKTLDRLGAHNQVGPAEIGALLEGAGHSVPLDDVLHAASDIRRARES